MKEHAERESTKLTPTLERLFRASFISSKRFHSSFRHKVSRYTVAEGQLA